VGESAEEMLMLGRESERSAVARFNAAAQECHDLGDHGTAAVFEEMVRDEEKHADWFESQLEAIVRVGVQQYLAQQIRPGQSPS
jgi:bacterioferritin